MKSPRGPALVVSDIFPPRHGGSGRWLYEIYRRLQTGGVVVAAGEFAGAAEFDRQSGLATVRLPLRLAHWGCFSPSGARGYLSLVRQLRGVVRRYGVRELHVARCLTEGFAAWLMKRLFGVPFVVFVHGEETRTSASSREFTWMTRRVFAAARLLVANSENTAQVLCTEWAIPRDHVRVLNPGVDAQRFCPAPRDAADRDQLGWGARPVLLTVGRLQVRKGHDMLIRALPAIRTHVPDVLYAVIGDGEERPRLEALARELGVEGHVRFHGDPDDAVLIRGYRQCDVFVLPNREVDGDFEGFGMVLLEAQACGKPVIAGASGGTREALIDGVTGRVLDCTTPDELGRVIPEWLRDPAALTRMGDQGRRLVLQRFDWPALVQQASSILDVPAPDSGLAGG